MNFADDQGFNVKKAGGIGVAVVMHLVLAGAVIYGLRTTFVTKPKMEEVQVVMPEAPPPTVDPTPPAPPKPQMKTPEIQTPPETPVEQAPVPAPPPDPAPAPQASNDAPPAPPSTNTDANAGNGTAGVTSPAITDLNSCKPAYPQAALMQNQTGTVRVKFVIGVDGNLVNADVVKSSGYKTLDRAAVDGLSKCKFKPAMQNGNPVQSWFVTDYVWSLND